MVIMNGLYIKDMKLNLLSPFIMRLAGLEVNEKPKFMTRKRKDQAPFGIF